MRARAAGARPSLASSKSDAVARSSAPSGRMATRTLAAVRVPQVVGLHRRRGYQRAPMYPFRDFSRRLRHGYMLGDGTSRERGGRRTMAVEVAATRRRFTRAEYHRMAEVGILREDDRVELIRGEIVEMSPIGRRHKAFVGNVAKLLIVRLGDRATVWIQSSIVLSE